AEVAAWVGPADVVVEGRPADGAVDHDGQRRGDAGRQAVVIGFPGLQRVGKTQVRDGEAGEAGLGLGAASGGAFVADLAARAGGCPRDRKSTSLNSSHVKISYAVFCLQ